MPAAPPTRPRLRARYHVRRRAIGDAAARVFAERGYHATSVAALLDATGLSAGALYHYVATRDDLLVLICDELMDPLLDRARAIVAAGEEDPSAQLRSVLHAWLRHIARHLDHMRVFQQERHVIERDPRWREIRAKRLEFERIVDGVLARLEERCSGAVPDRRLTLLALLGMVNYTATWFRPGGRSSAAQIADSYCDLVLNAYSPDGGRDER